MCIKFPRLTFNGLIAYKVLLILFVLLAGFRYYIGLDTYSYTIEYNTFPNILQLNYSFIDDSTYKILWILFESILRYVSNSFYLLQLILAIFVNYVVFTFVKKYSINPFLTILLFYLIFYLNLNMEILRESVSVCLLLLGIDLLIKKDFVKYYCLAIIAFYFHESGIILFFVPFIFFIKPNKKVYFFIIVMLIIFSELISIYIVDNLLKINDYNIQIKMNYFSSVGTARSSLIFNYTKYIITPSIILFSFFKHLKYYERNNILLYIVFSILFTQAFIFYRIRDYFLILLLISFTNGLEKKIRPKFKHILKPAFVCCFLFIYLFRAYYDDINVNGYQPYLNYYPYNSIIDEEIPQSRIDNINR